MSDETPTALLRPGRLEDVVVVIGGSGELGAATGAACAALGAAVETLGVAPAAGLDEETCAAGAGAALAAHGRIDLLVVDAAALFAAAGAGLDGVRAAADGAWAAVHAVAGAAFIDADRGRIVLLAPAPRAGAHAAAARAALENTARTLSIEWARHGIRPTAVLPGDVTSAAEVAQLVAFLASPAGDYHAGCRFELGVV